MEEDKVIFEDYGIEITDKDIEGVDIATLVECKTVLEDAIGKYGHEDEEEEEE